MPDVIRVLVLASPVGLLLRVRLRVRLRLVRLAPVSRLSEICFQALRVLWIEEWKGGGRVAGVGLSRV